MNYDNFITFNVETENAIAWVTFDNPLVNIQDTAMLNDLNNLAEQLERDRSIKVVVFQSAHPEIFIAHYDTGLLKDMSMEAVPRQRVVISYLQLYQATSKTPAIKRFTMADETGFQNDIDNQRNFETALMDLQEVE